MSRRLCYLASSGAALVLVAMWGVWIPHKTAGLTLCGWDLTEFVKFLPGVRSGADPIQREFFYLPVWCVGLVFALLAHQSNNGAVGWMRRLALLALGLALLLLILPPYPFIKTAQQSAEFRGQFYLGAAGVLLLMGSPLTSYAPTRLVGGVMVFLALLGGVPALWQFALVYARVEALYGSSPGLGWGVVMLLAGWGLVLAAGVGLCARRD